MKQKLTIVIKSFSFFMAIFLVAFTATNAQTMEKLIVYENFGGIDAGSSVSGIQPDKWPAVVADSAETCGWSASLQKLDNKDATELVYQFHGNGFADIDTIAKNKDGGIGGLPITVNSTTKKWTKSAPLRNGYQMPFTSATSIDFGFYGAAVLPDFSSWMSQASYAPAFNKNVTDEKGYIYTGKDVNSKRPEITIPSSSVDVFQDMSKIEIMFSGSRLGQNNTLSVRLEEQNAAGTTIGTDTFTYSVSIEPRTITILNSKQYTRIHIDTWGSANNANVTDYALLNNNTEVDFQKDYNYNAIKGIKPDGTTSNGQTGNPGISIHMIKIYAKVAGAGYTITTDDALVSGTKTGISYGATTILTAAVTNASSKKFMGWKISGRPDLSEVVNPLTIAVTEDMTIMPVYVGDEVEVAVVDENFTNWTQYGNTLPDKNNRLDYNQGTPDEATMLTGDVKVPLRYGYTSGGKDSVTISLVKCNVIPQYGLRVYNAPGWEKTLGYIAFMGPNDNKGYVIVDSLEGITKAMVSLSSYDQPAPDRACAVKINNDLVRNKMLRTLYAEDLEVTNDPANKIKLQVGPGNQARIEYLSNPNPLADIFSGDISAAAVAMHNLKMYAKITLADKSYYKLTTPSVSGGIIAGLVPSAGNSTQHYIEGTQVTLSAKADADFGFDGWYDGSNNLISKSNPLTITMDADKTVQPKFAKLYSYVKMVENVKGDITPSIEPLETNADTMTFYAGVSLNLTATPIYGFTFTKWVVNGVDQTSNPLSLTSTQMGSNITNVISVEYDSITARQSVAIKIDQTKGSIDFNHDPENLTTDGDTLRANFPAGETIEASVVDGYGYEFDYWKKGLDVPDADTLNSTATVTLSKPIKLAVVFIELPRYQLTINQGLHGTIAVTDSHKDGTQEQAGMWPENYWVELTATPETGYYLNSVGADVTANYISETVVNVKMDKDPVTVNPEFLVISEYKKLKQNFQDPVLWPMAEGNVSNVPGAIDFLGKPADWDPINDYSNYEDLLTDLSEYRVWGSASNDNSDGPNGTKDPMTTLKLFYTNDPLVNEVSIEGSQAKATITAVNYSTCNDCLIGKAVKSGNVTKRYLGHVSPGCIALRGLNVTNRAATSGAALRAGDSIGVMVIEGFVYVETVEVGYVSSGSQFCPGVFYTTNPDVEVIGSDNNFAAKFSDLWPLGQDYPPTYRPDQDKYGWGCSQEGMIMDQGMTVGEEDVDDTRIIITSGYKTEDPNYAYTTIYIHDIMVEGSPKTVSIDELINDQNSAGHRFYMIGNTNILQAEINEPIKAMVIYNMNGVAVKVLRNIENENNQINVENLKKGVYGVHCYGKSGKVYKGTFGKINE